MNRRDDENGGHFFGRALEERDEDLVFYPEASAFDRSDLGHQVFGNLGSEGSGFFGGYETVENFADLAGDVGATLEEFMETAREKIFEGV